MHHAALYGPGPHDGDLDHQVFVAARLQARQHRHLRPALDLEHADGVGVADHVEHLLVVVGNMVHLHHRAAPAVHVVEAAAYGAEHAEREHVDLEHAHGFEVVLLPLDDGAVFHRCLLDRHQPRELGVREHKAAHVLAQVARKALEALRHLDPLHQLELVFLHADARGRLEQLLAQHGVVEPVVVFCELVDQALVDADGLAHVAQGAACAVADDDGRNGCALAAVLFVDVLDDLFAPLVLEVDIDVGRLVAMPAQEALEQQVAFFRVDRGNAQAVADDRVGRGTAPLAKDVLRARKAHDVFHREKEHLVLQLDDQREFLFDLLAHLVGDALGKADRRALPGLAHQRLHGRLVVAHGFERVLVGLADHIGIEPAALGHHQRVRQHFGEIQLGQPHPLPQMPLGIRLQRKAAFGHGLAFAHGREHVVQRLGRARMHVHVAGRHQRHARVLARLHQRDKPQVVVELVEHFHRQPQVLSIERLGGQQVFMQRGDVHGTARRPVRHEKNLAVLQRSHVALVPAHAVFALGQLGVARGGDELAQVAPALGVVGDDHEPEALEAELAAEQQPEIGVARKRRLVRMVALVFFQFGRQIAQADVRAHDAGHRAFVGNGQRRVAELVGALDHLLGRRGAALKAEVGQAVQLGVVGQRGRRLLAQGQRQRMHLGGVASAQLLFAQVRHRTPAGTSALRPGKSVRRAARERSTPVRLRGFPPRSSRAWPAGRRLPCRPTSRLRRAAARSVC